MYLTRQEEDVLSGRFGDVVSRAMSVIVKVGEALGADRLVEVDTAHVAGVSYFTIGDPGLEYLEDLARNHARFSVFTTVNPIGMDVINELGVDEEFSRKQWRIISALRAMGASLWLTCTPYEILRIRPRTRHAWAESNAVAYINAVNDAWTEKLPGPFVIMAAITGRVPRYGLYTLEGRVPTHEVRVDFDVKDPLIAGLVGREVAKAVGEGKPYVVMGIQGMAVIKQLLASYATYSPHAYMVIHGITPNHNTYRDLMDKHEVLTIEKRDVEVRTDYSGSVDAVYLGCPHYGLEEVLSIVDFVRRRGWGRARIPIYVGTSLFVINQLGSELVNKLRESNIFLITSTCPVVSPFMRGKGIGRVATESVKQMYYLPKMVNIDYVPCTGIECLEMAFGG
ncbi:aconitase X catalytic domain-containing protein [Vulcanisaeta thermophila]|uniref:aconitase X catalytic domain-containing protein n=1 Tax=Vulcanisaeta thermophila TaxID=867917 RepID=UPI000852AC4F|nr:aconitase X catalytic domain-containing protein [Vulcanisaeta thermophila]